MVLNEEVSRLKCGGFHLVITEVVAVIGGADKN